MKPEPHSGSDPQYSKPVTVSHCFLLGPFFVSGNVYISWTEKANADWASMQMGHIPT